MKKALLLPLFVLFALSDISAQYYTNQNKVWVFGKNAGLNFNSGSPVPFPSGIDQAEGSASVSDALGNLLFYTDGKKVYNSAGSVMPSGGSLAPFFTYSTSQAALIVPVFSNPNQYYIFSLENSLGDSTGHLAYSVVDMSLAGGLGDVVVSSIGIPLQDSMGEKMIAVRGNIGGDNNSMWVLAHKKDTGIFLAYEINAAGVNTTPVVSVAGTLSGYLGYAIGVIKASPNGRKIACQSFRYSSASNAGTELFDFDPATGMVSNCIVLDSANSQYGAEFSPDNTKLYVQQSISSNVMKIFQYNIALPDANAIRASKTEIAEITTQSVTDLKLAPDHKIYMFGTDDSTKALFLGYSRFLDCISAPNLLGTSCGYIPHAVQLPAGMGMRAGLPNLYISSDIGSVAVAGIPDLPAIAIYPNPATSQLTITAPEKIIHLSIRNMVGQEVYSHEYNTEMVKVDVTELRTGVYFIKVNSTVVRKFVKQ